MILMNSNSIQLFKSPSPSSTEEDFDINLFQSEIPEAAEVQKVLEQYEEQISELKAKLIESEETINTLNGTIKELENKLSKYDSEDTMEDTMEDISEDTAEDTFEDISEDISEDIEDEEDLTASESEEEIVAENTTIPTTQTIVLGSEVDIDTAVDNTTNIYNIPYTHQRLQSVRRSVPERLERVANIKNILD